MKKLVCILLFISSSPVLAAMSVSSISHSCFNVVGFAYWDEDGSKAATVQLVVDGNMISAELANRYNPVLGAASPFANHSFWFSLPASFVDGQTHSIEVRALGHGVIYTSTINTASCIGLPGAGVISRLPQQDILYTLGVALCGLIGIGVGTRLL